MKIDRTATTTLLRASRKALFATGHGYVPTLGEGVRKKSDARKMQEVRERDDNRVKGVAFKKPYQFV